MTDSKPRIVRSHDVHLDDEYADWIRDVKSRYRSAQIKAAVRVNAEQLLFNWELGHDLVVRKAEERWGSGVVEQVSLDLKDEFPDARGFSTRNLRYMKQWYLFYATKDSQALLHQLGAEIAPSSSARLSHAADVEGNSILHQLGAETAGMPFPQVFSCVPWRHHVEIITHCKSLDEAAYYIKRTVQEGWSRSTLEHAIEGDYFHKSGNAITNFKELLPAAQSELAQAITKDTYDLGFISLPPEYDERDLERALEQNITRFLLELGKGFAFMGRQVEILVSGKTRRIDMLFFHVNLNCYVVLELKVRSFEPEFAGKLNFYVNAVDDLLKTDTQNPTIGLLICKDKDVAEVQWAFKGIHTPLGVATYENVEEAELSKYLPTNKQIQHQIEMAEREFIQGLGDHATSEVKNPESEE